MIAIVTSSPRELAWLTTLCDVRSWPSHPCANTNDFTKLTEQAQPRVIVTRTQLSDGYSDDILAVARKTDRESKTIVLAPADYPTSLEARQVDLGADCVLRDPVRTDVLLAFVRRFFELETEVKASPAVARYRFAGAEVCPTERRVTRDGKTTQLTLQEMALVRLLHYSEGKVVPYTAIYGELFSRRYEGDTANARVLFGRTARALAQVGVALRDYVEVVSKTGYLYSGKPKPAPLKNPRRATPARRAG